MSKAKISQFALMTLLCVTLFTARYLMNRSDPKDDDARIVSLLAKPGTREALSWLETAPSGTRTVGGGDKEYDHTDALKLVRELYHRGAVKVTAIDIVTDSDEDGHEVQYTDTLIVELPDNPESRRSLFDLDKQEITEEYDPAEEAGQKYFLMWWD
jgi:hypothetical protein